MPFEVPGRGFVLSGKGPAKRHGQKIAQSWYCSVKCTVEHSTDDHIFSMNLTFHYGFEKQQRGCITLSPLKGGGDAVPPPPKIPEPNLNSLVGDDVDGAIIAGVAEAVVDVDTEGVAKGKRIPPGAAGRVEGAEKEKAGVEFTTDARGGAGARVGAGAGASGAT